MGGVVAKADHPEEVCLPETKLEAKMVEAIQKKASRGTTIRSFNSIVLKFPRIDENLRKCKAIFEEFDEDANGRIDHEELKRCFHKLEIRFSEEEINDMFDACDINDDKGMEFNEFIVLLCLTYLLKTESSNPDSAEYHFKFEVIASTRQRRRTGTGQFGIVQKPHIEMQGLETTFETLVDAFVFLDKNNDGHVSKNEMVEAINESTSGERSSGRIAMKRFEEMDWDKNGSVNFKEFLFAFTHWVGINDTEDDEDES